VSGERGALPSEMTGRSKPNPLRNHLLESLDRILNRAGDADDVLREVVRVLHDRYDYVSIRFVEGDELAAGPSAGSPGSKGSTWPIAFQGTKVAELEVAPAEEGDREFLERVTTIVSPYCLVGWDTGGERWAP
jgi:hypothetical protein